MPVAEVFRRISSVELTAWLALYRLEHQEEQDARAEAELEQSQGQLGQAALEKLRARRAQRHGGR